MKRNGDDRIRELERRVLETGARDLAALESLARELRRREHGVPRGVEAEAIARDAYWADVRALAQLVHAHGFSRRFVHRIDGRTATWNDLFGGRRLAPCPECRRVLVAGDEFPNERLCDVCAEVPEDPATAEPWENLARAVLATGRFEGFPGLVQIASQSSAWLEGALAHTLEGLTQQDITPDNALHWLLRDVANEAEMIRLRSHGNETWKATAGRMPRGGDRVAFRAAGPVGERFAGSDPAVVLQGATGTVVYSRLMVDRGGADGSSEIIVRLDPFAWSREEGGDIPTREAPHPLIAYWNNVDNFLADTQQI